MADPNVIRLIPVPAAGYEHVGKMAQAGADLAALMTAASGPGGRETTGENDG